jgi:ribosomal protein S18 acetylase RimI-like enzyme
VNLGYRACTREDEAFLYALHRSTMRVYVEETWGEWDETWQRETFRRRFSPEDVFILQLDGEDIGMVSVQERTEELFLSRIEILSAYQRRGIGSQVLRELIEQAGAQGKAVALKVLKSNRSARSLYQRLGFGVTGETDTHYVMATLVPGR